MLIRSGEARLVGWSRQMLYSGFNILPRSVIRSASSIDRSDNLDVMSLELMLELKSERWSDLNHAYGVASDIPQWLNDLKSGDAAISDAWDNLCHQFTVYSATFATVPHILLYAKTATAEELFESLVFIGTVHARRQPKEIDATPSDILEWYDRSVLTAANLALERFLNGKLDDTNAIYLLEAVAGLQGCSGPGRILSGFADGEFTIECPGCKFELYVWPETSGGFFAASSDPVFNPESKRTDVAPASPPPAWDGKSFECSEAFIWLSEISIRAGYPKLASSLRYLYGNITCPECSNEFNLMRELENAT